MVCLLFRAQDSRPSVLLYEHRESERQTDIHQEREKQTDRHTDRHSQNKILECIYVLMRLTIKLI